MHPQIEYLADGEFSLSVTLLAHTCLSSFQGRCGHKQGWLNQSSICFTANQWKSRLLLICTAGELETHSLGLCLQSEPDCLCTTSNKQARINHMLYSENFEKQHVCKHVFIKHATVKRETQSDTGSITKPAVEKGCMCMCACTWPVSSSVEHVILDHNFY